MSLPAPLAGALRRPNGDCHRRGAGLRCGIATRLAEAAAVSWSPTATSRAPRRVPIARRRGPSRRGRRGRHRRRGVRSPPCSTAPAGSTCSSTTPACSPTPMATELSVDEFDRILSVNVRARSSAHASSPAAASPGQRGAIVNVAVRRRPGAVLRGPGPLHRVQARRRRADQGAVGRACTPRHPGQRRVPRRGDDRGSGRLRPGRRAPRHRLGGTVGGHRRAHPDAAG